MFILYMMTLNDLPEFTLFAEFSYVYFKYNWKLFSNML